MTKLPIEKPITVSAEQLIAKIDALTVMDKAADTPVNDFKLIMRMVTSMMQLEPYIATLPKKIHAYFYEADRGTKNMENIANLFKGIGWPSVNNSCVFTKVPDYMESYLKLAIPFMGSTGTVGLQLRSPYTKTLLSSIIFTGIENANIHGFTMGVPKFAPLLGVIALNQEKLITFANTASQGIIFLTTVALRPKDALAPVASLLTRQAATYYKLPAFSTELLTAGAYGVTRSLVNYCLGSNNSFIQELCESAAMMAGNAAGHYIGTFFSDRLWKGAANIYHAGESWVNYINNGSQEKEKQL